MSGFIVTVDGPAGSGKSTIAKLIAKKYGLTYLDTGAMYRMIALYALKHNVNLENGKEIADMLEKARLDIQGNVFYLDGEDVSEEIRSPQVNNIVSNVAAIKEVRHKLVDMQREIGNGKRIIMDGRDIGTTVFPNADVKIFLIASAETRALRRLKEYEDKKVATTFDEVLASIKERDRIDSTRKESPLVKASDAHEVDSSKMTIDDVLATISKYIDAKLGD
ncbi:Cytidylate kinase [Fusobacterium sp. DD29]|uniref:(d)CMP kinase n=1 Tax=unclassified Fusobacterium TaxID=2648384 RepID=UPI001B8C21B3|nr:MULTISPECIES: (d)CMP kinase [unclassified Fusobacterium]MBR8700551.1 Cytidylate kinase [Fusobacterium sp. DD45]MBR8710300.1 Cytidylate kinase [Fusobacterium sp. DD28]MBR8749302.1 Cytidylate kinase [Fusobacterium sp. DD29]MBR8750814.1 Cytidylate kinase [Fusobacterium sp. DD26]MBR8761568.1 Cytidylate kinase [Fusobacterium sp. DD25]